MFVLSWIYYFIRKFVWTTKKAHIESVYYVSSFFIIRNKKINGRQGKIRIGKNFHAEHFSQIITYGGDVEIGNNFYLGPYSILYAHGGLKIGDNVMVANHCTVIPANHTFSRLDIPIGLQPETYKGITIDDDVWISSGVCILDGVYIGKGSVIGAGSVVTKDLPPYSVSTGVPAVVKKNRIN